MPSGFMPVVIDLRPSMTVMIPSGKPVPRNGNPKRERGAERNPSLTRRVTIAYPRANAYFRRAKGDDDKFTASAEQRKLSGEDSEVTTPIRSTLNQFIKLLDQACKPT